VSTATPRYSAEVLSLIINSDGFVLKRKDNVVFRFVYSRVYLNMFSGQSIFLEKYGPLGKMISVCTLISGISNSIFHSFYKASHIRPVLIGYILISRREQGKDVEISVTAVNNLNSACLKLQKLMKLTISLSSLHNNCGLCSVNCGLCKINRVSCSAMKEACMCASL